jgi:hypothetical protein
LANARIPALLGLVGLALSAPTGARAAGELTGTYAGSLSCRLQGASITSVPTFVRISERGSSPEGASLVVDIDGARYSGRAAAGDAAFAHCGSINPAYGAQPSGFEQVSYRVDAATGAATLHVASRSEFGLCEATWTRIDASEPGIPACGK